MAQPSKHKISEKKRYIIIAIITLLAVSLGIHFFLQPSTKSPSSKFFKQHNNAGVAGTGGGGGGQGGGAQPGVSTYAISGNVFIDTNRNGILDTGESGYQWLVFFYCIVELGSVRLYYGVIIPAPAT